MRQGDLTSLWREESGQAMTEYILLLSIVVIAAARLGRALLQTLDEGVARLGGQLEKDLKTGRSPLNVWKN